MGFSTFNEKDGIDTWKICAMFCLSFPLYFANVGLDLHIRYMIPIHCPDIVAIMFLLKVLLPLVNVPMINYTLAWLESAGVEEVIVFCCAHARQVIDYLESSDWFSQPHFTVTTIESHHCISAGDALRLIYERNVVCSASYFYYINNSSLIKML